MDNKTGKLDKPLFIMAFAVLAIISLPTIIFPDSAMGVVDAINAFIVTNLGNYYIWFALGTVIFCLYISFSKYGKILLGDAGTKPEYSNFAWASMLFCGGIGATVIYWGSIQWVYHWMDPPLHYAAGTPEAQEIAAALGPYYWGFITWTIYITCAVACAYLIYVRKGTIFRISEVCRGALGNRIDGPLGKIIDVGFMFGLIGAAATAFGLQTPLFAAILSRLTGLPDTIPLRVGILLGIACIFAVSTFLGLKKGMSRLSSLNVAVALILLAFITFAGNAVFTLNMATTSLGVIADKFISFSTWMDPVGVTDNFPAWWTVFYWAWAVTYAPYFGLFYAKISKGRTMREMIVGTVGYGTLGCFTVFAALQGHGMYKDHIGAIDVVESMQTIGAPETIVNILETLPFSTLVLVVTFAVLLVFSATTYDAVSGVLASVSQYSLDESGEAKPWLRLLWAFMLILLPLGFIISGSQLRALQTIVIVFALPLTFVMIITVISFFKMIKADVNDGKYVLPK